MKLLQIKLIAHYNCRNNNIIYKFFGAKATHDEAGSRSQPLLLPYVQVQRHVNVNPKKFQHYK